ncbi:MULTISPECIES: DUF3152 domain-containing protein [unclassified Actinoplanes]|uniref:DUF3152 domain-containing protein n=1 Tax=unclassified Actinoplanes TaxID=2626549 RepID=UPI001E64AB92|nr:MULTISPECIES: DUF3152 domain-containing protein [unclassified Actinoplanes]
METSGGRHRMSGEEPLARHRAEGAPPRLNPSAGALQGSAAGGPQGSAAGALQGSAAGALHGSAPGAPPGSSVGSADQPAGVPDRSSAARHAQPRPAPPPVDPETGLPPGMTRGILELAAERLAASRAAQAAARAAQATPTDTDSAVPTRQDAAEPGAPGVPDAGWAAADLRRHSPEASVGHGHRPSFLPDAGPQAARGVDVYGQPVETAPRASAAGAASAAPDVDVYHQPVVITEAELHAPAEVEPQPVDWQSMRRMRAARAAALSEQRAEPRPDPAAVDGQGAGLQQQEPPAEAEPIVEPDRPSRRRPILRTTADTPAQPQDAGQAVHPEAGQTAYSPGTEPTAYPQGAGPTAYPQAAGPTAYPQAMGQQDAAIRWSEADLDSLRPALPPQFVSDTAEIPRVYPDLHDRSVAWPEPEPEDPHDAWFWSTTDHPPAGLPESLRLPAGIPEGLWHPAEDERAAAGSDLAGTGLAASDVAGMDPAWPAEDAGSAGYPEYAELAGDVGFAASMGHTGYANPADQTAFGEQATHEQPAYVDPQQSGHIPAPAAAPAGADAAGLTGAHAAGLAEAHAVEVNTAAAAEVHADDLPTARGGATPVVEIDRDAPPDVDGQPEESGTLTPDGRKLLRRRRRVTFLAYVMVVALVLVVGHELRDRQRPVAEPEAARPAPIGAPEADRGQRDHLAEQRGSALSETNGKAGHFRYVTSRGSVLGTGGDLHRFKVAVEETVGDVAPDDFARTVDRTLGDRRSWIGGGKVRLRRVPKSADNAEFTVFLASPTTSEKMCAAGGLHTEGFTSCRVPGQVIINAERWATAIPEYDGHLGEYREYTINHEVGHQLGHGHEGCPGKGEPAPVMLQQTYGLEGCTRNAWPFLDGERYAGDARP